MRSWGVKCGSTDGARKKPQAIGPGFDIFFSVTHKALTPALSQREGELPTPSLATCHDFYGVMMSAVPAAAPPSNSAPRKLSGTGSIIHGAQLPGR